MSMFRDHLEALLDREIGVGERLRLDALRRVDQQHRALARGERAAHLICEVDVAGRIDEVELVVAPYHADRARLDGDPVLPLELHRVENLIAHLAERHRSGRLEQAVGQSRLAVVHVRDDAEVADPGELGHLREG